MRRLIALCLGSLLSLACLAADTPLLAATNFAGFDLLRAVAGPHARVEMIVRPGTDAHTLTITPRDLARLRGASLLVHAGRSDEALVRRIAQAAETPPTVLALTALVPTVPTLGADGRPGKDPDEHVWVSPALYARLVDAVRNRLAELFPEHAQDFARNAAQYRAEIESVDREFAEIVREARSRTLVVGDRFAMIYFARQYGLQWISPFPGCSHQAQASARSVAETARDAKRLGSRAVLKEELSSDRTARTVAEAAGAQVLVFWTGHGVSKEDFETGVSWVDRMRGNLGVLREALR